jgi:hypothetical protein
MMDRAQALGGRSLTTGSDSVATNRNRPTWQGRVSLTVTAP